MKCSYTRREVSCESHFYSQLFAWVFLRGHEDCSFWGGGEKKKVQKHPWLQLESTDFLQREFFWPRVGVKVMHQWWSSPPQPLRKHWHILHTIKLLETQKWVGLKGCKRHQSQSKMNLNTAKKTPKKQSENFAQTTSIQKHTDYSNDKNKIFIPQQCHTTRVE